MAARVTSKGHLSSTELPFTAEYSVLYRKNSAKCNLPPAAGFRHGSSEIVKKDERNWEFKENQEGVLRTFKINLL